MRVMLIRYHNIGNINTRLPESINRVQGVYPPLGIAYVASTLEKFGHDVRILDSRALNLTAEETKKHIEKFNPDVVGITCMSSTIKGSLEAAYLTKQVSKGIVTVMGGPQVFIYPKETTNYDFVDFGIAGEGEIIMPELLEALDGKKKLGEIDGLVYKKNGIKFNPAKRYVKDLDSLPFPARHLLPNYKYFSILSDHPFTTLITSRGCPFRCGYCFRKKLDRIVRYRSAKNVVDEIQYCLEKWKFREIWFYDDTFTMNKRHAAQICKEIIDRGLDFKWEAVTRVDCVSRGMLRLMKKAGCRMVRYGIESGDQETLNIMKKGITLEQAKKATKWTRETGMESFCFFMIGYPNEDEKKIKNTIDFAKNLNIDWAMFSNVTPYPSTDLLELAYEKGLLKDREYWRKFTLGKTNERIPYEFPDMDRWVKKAYKSFYLRPGFAAKTLFKIKSLRQVKKYLLGLYAILNFKTFSS